METYINFFVKRWKYKIPVNYNNFSDRGSYPVSRYLMIGIKIFPE
jgi:hypothetical protein